MKKVLFCIICAGSVIVLVLVLLSGIRYVNEAKAIKLFNEYALEFEKEKDIVSMKYGKSDVSNRLSECGIHDIYSTGKYAYFEFEKKVLGMFPHGFIYTDHIEDVPKWYITKRIADKWYYYRICS